MRNASSAEPNIPLYRSCRNRHCPRCQAQAREAWLECSGAGASSGSLLPCCFHRSGDTQWLALYCPEIFYAALLQAAGNALLDVGLTKLQARLGCLTILHTWGQNLSLHPHVHCVVPGGVFPRREPVDRIA